MHTRVFRRRAAHARRYAALLCSLSLAVMTTVTPADAQTPPVARASAKTQKPPLHGRKWMAITGKPLAATAGALIFERGGNAVDAACAMLAATSTMRARAPVNRRACSRRRCSASG